MPIPLSAMMNNGAPMDPKTAVLFQMAQMLEQQQGQSPVIQGAGRVVANPGAMIGDLGGGLGSLVATYLASKEQQGQRDRFSQERQAVLGGEGPLDPRQMMMAEDPSLRGTGADLAVAQQRHQTERDLMQGRVHSVQTVQGSDGQMHPLVIDAYGNTKVLPDVVPESYGAVNLGGAHAMMPKHGYEPAAAYPNTLGPQAPQYDPNTGTVFHPGGTGGGNGPVLEQTQLPNKMQAESAIKAREGVGKIDMTLRDIQAARDALKNMPAVGGLRGRIEGNVRAELLNDPNYQNFDAIAKRLSLSTLKENLGSQNLSNADVIFQIASQSLGLGMHRDVNASRLNQLEDQMKSARKELESRMQEGGSEYQGGKAELRGVVRGAAQQVGANPDLMEEIARRESSFVPRENTWDRNAAKGTPSNGVMQFIEPTFNQFYAEMQQDSPGMLEALGPKDWKDSRQQALLAAWAVKHGKGNHWSTYGAAKASVVPEASRGRVPQPARQPARPAAPTGQQPISLEDFLNE